MYEQVIAAACAVVLGLTAMASDESRKPPVPAPHQAAEEGPAPTVVHSRLARHLDALLDELILLSLQPGNDEDENQAVSAKIDAVHEAGIQLYDDLNKCEYSHEALTPLVARYMALRDRTFVLVTAHGPVRTHLPAPFAAMKREVEQVIGVIRREIHAGDDVEQSRENAVSELYHAAAELQVDLIWSGLRKRHKDVPDLQARFATVRKRSRELFPGDRQD